MANRAALVRKAELTRILRASREAGVAVDVRFRPDGEIRVTSVDGVSSGSKSLADEMFS